MKGGPLLKVQGKRLNTEERKNQILSIATDVFYRDGYEKASLQEIAKKARITKAAIYHHFKNKEEILFNLVVTISDRLIFDLREILKRKNDPVEQLREMLIQHLSYMKRDKAKVKILIEDRHFLGKKYEAIIKGKQKEIFEIYRKKFEEITKLGRLRDVHIVTANFSLFGIMNWLYHWYNPKGELGIEEITDDIIHMIFHGLIKEDRSGPS